LACPAPERSPR